MYLLPLLYPRSTVYYGYTHLNVNQNTQTEMYEYYIGNLTKSEQKNLYFIIIIITKKLRYLNKKKIWHFWVCIIFIIRPSFPNKILHYDITICSVWIYFRREFKDCVFFVDTCGLWDRISAYYTLSRCIYSHVPHLLTSCVG